MRQHFPGIARCTAAALFTAIGFTGVVGCHDHDDRPRDDDRVRYENTRSDDGVRYDDHRADSHVDRDDHNDRR